MGSGAWLEIEPADEVTGDLRRVLAQAVEGSSLEILRIKNPRLVERVMGRVREDESLDDLSPEEVFERRLDREDLTEDERATLREAHMEILNEILEDEPREGDGP